MNRCILKVILPLLASCLAACTVGKDLPPLLEPQFSNGGQVKLEITDRRTNIPEFTEAGNLEDSVTTMSKALVEALNMAHISIDQTARVRLEVDITDYHVHYTSRNHAEIRLTVKALSANNGTVLYERNLMRDITGPPHEFGPPEMYPAGNEALAHAAKYIAREVASDAQLHSRIVENSHVNPPPPPQTPATPVLVLPHSP